MPRAVVTGGSGFIGTPLVERLQAEGIEVVLYDHSTGYNNDIRYAGILLDACRGADVVFHLAGLLGTHELFDDPWAAIETNCTGTLNVLEACRHNGAAYVGVTMPQVFPSIYTATKVFGTRLATAYHREYGVPVSHVRAFNAYGPGQKWGPGHPQKIIPTFALAAWRNDPIPIWGDGEQGVDLIHTSDLARLFVDAWALGGDDYTVDGGTGQMMTVMEVAVSICAITKSQSRIERLPMRRGEEPTHIVAEGEGWDRLDWKPEQRYSDMLDTLRWYKDRA